MRYQFQPRPKRLETKEKYKREHPRKVCRANKRVLVTPRSRSQLHRCSATVKIMMSSKKITENTRGVNPVDVGKTRRGNNLVSFPVKTGLLIWEFCVQTMEPCLR